MAADLRVRLFPAAERLGGRRLAVVEAEGAEHPFGVEEEQVRGVPGLVLAERAVEQLDRIEGQGRGPARRAVGGVAAGFGGRGPGLGRRAGPAGGIPSATRACSAIRAPVPMPSMVSAWRLLRPLRGFGLACSSWVAGSSVAWGSSGVSGSGVSWIFGVWWLSPLPSTFFKSEVLCPVSTSRKIASRGTCPCNRPRPGVGSSPRTEILTDCLHRRRRVSRRGRQPVVMGSGQCTRRPRSLSQQQTLPGSVVARLPLSVQAVGCTGHFRFLLVLMRPTGSGRGRSGRPARTSPRPRCRAG